MNKQQQEEINALRARLQDVQIRLQHIIIADHPVETALAYLQELKEKDMDRTLFEGMTPQGFEVECTTNGKTLKVDVNGRKVITFEFHVSQEEDAKTFARLICVSRITVQK